MSVAAHAGRVAARLAAALVALAAAMPAGAQLRAFEFRLDNDQFAFASPNRERWYTSGEFIRLGFDAPAGAPDTRLVDAWCARVISCDPVARTMRVLSLDHRIYTPAFSATASPQPFDRPYAASLGLGWAVASTGDRSRQMLEMQLGTVGPAALGDEVQNAIHGVLGQEKVRGWGWQVRAQPLMQLGWSRLHGLALTRGELDVVTRTAVLLGNPVTQAGVGAMVRYGRLPDGPTWPGEAMGARHRWGWHVFGGVEARAIGRDALIDGDTYAYASRVEREPFAGSAFVGASWANDSDWHLDIAFAIHSVPFSTPRELDPLRPQRIGTIGLRWQPTR